MLEHGKHAVPKLLEEALDRLIDMRTTEGKAVAADLLSQRDYIRSRMTLIAERAPLVVNEYHAKLAVRVNELMAKAKLKVDERDLIREVAVFADRADISEELSRMNGHLGPTGRPHRNRQPRRTRRAARWTSSAKKCCVKPTPLAAKATTPAISRAVVEVKKPN